MENFWPIGRCRTKLKNEIIQVHTVVKNATKLIAVLVVFGMLAYVSKPALSSTKSLILQSYHPVDLNQSPDYEAILALQLCLCVAVPCLLGFDGLFISFIINFVCELKVIKTELESLPINPSSKMNTNISLEELYKIIHHHDLILECIKDVREIYSFLLLTVYLNNMLCMCAGLLAIIVTGFPPNLENLSRYGTYLVFYTMQLFFYCMVGTCLINESESVSVAAYEAAWWAETQLELRRALMLVIQRANKSEKLTAGGMFALNLASFRKVTRTALSFFTLVEAVYKDT